MKFENLYREKLKEKSKFKELASRLNDAMKIDPLWHCDKIHEDTVIDEEKSVKWNREQCRKINDNYMAEYNMRWEIKEQVIKEAMADILAYIPEYLGVELSDDTVRMIWDQVDDMMNPNCNPYCTLSDLKEYLDPIKAIIADIKK